MRIDKQSRQKYEMLASLLKSFCELSTIFYQSWHLSLRRFPELASSLLELLASTTLYERLSQFIDSFEETTNLPTIIEDRKFFTIWQVALLADVDADKTLSSWLQTLIETFNYLYKPMQSGLNYWLHEEGFTQGDLPLEKVDLLKTPRQLSSAQQEVKNG